jgi:hypothetical protein
MANGTPRTLLKPRVNRFALQRQHAEYTFMHAPKRLTLDEALQGFHAYAI